MKPRGMLTFDIEPETLFQGVFQNGQQRGCFFTVGCFVGLKGTSDYFGFFIDYFGNAFTPQAVGYSSFQYFVEIQN